jgi:RNA polymerase sigma factor (sigma-70 family)
VEGDPEAPLASRLAAGDLPALEEAYRLLGPSVLAYVRRHVGPADAPDVVQRVFTDVWRGASRYDPSRPLGPWVFGIARHRVTDELRARPPAAVPLHEAGPLPGERQGDMAADRAEALTVRAALDQLPAPQRTVLELAYFYGYPQSEISARLGVPLGTVKARAARGLRRLAALLKEQVDQ